ncbi:MAG: hypothetical protein LBE55_02465, partial [Clostridiales bacterium]|nr:hypothetical protein [Clostridiales bacterium]
MATIWVKLVPLVLTDLVNYLTNAPEPETNYWQTIDVYNVGSFRVPAEWYVEWDDRVLLVTDRP